MDCTMDVRRFLSGTFLFGSFTGPEIDLLASRTSVIRVRKGGEIFSEGLAASAFFVVVSGRVKIYKASADGKEHTLHIHGPGDVVAEAAIFDSMLYPASSAALEDSVLVRVPREGIIGLVKDHPELSLKMMSGYSKRLRQFVAKIEELTLKDIKARLAGYLLENSTVEEGVTLCRLRYRKRELSAFLGTVPETLSRALAFLKRRDLIVERGEVIVIPDPEMLRRFSGLPPG